MVWLDHARTDNSCDQQEKDEANYDSFQCLEAEKQNIEGKIRQEARAPCTLYTVIIIVIVYCHCQALTVTLPSWFTSLKNGCSQV